MPEWRFEAPWIARAAFSRDGRLETPSAIHGCPEAATPMALISILPLILQHFPQNRVMTVLTTK
jgi:hypothetical protein